MWRGTATPLGLTPASIPAFPTCLSPLQRAARTCELSGFGAGAITDRDLVEWDYGKYEGLTSAEILKQNPNWDLFRDGAPGGESPAQIGERADRVVERVSRSWWQVLPVEPSKPKRS